MFDHKVFKMQRYNSNTHYVCPKTQFQRRKKKLTSNKIKISPWTTFFWQKNNWNASFLKVIHDKSAYPNDSQKLTACLDVRAFQRISKEKWLLISKGLKHLKTVVLPCAVVLYTEYSFPLITWLATTHQTILATTHIGTETEAARITQTWCRSYWILNEVSERVSRISGTCPQTQMFFLWLDHLLTVNSFLDATLWRNRILTYLLRGSKPDRRNGIVD